MIDQLELGQERSAGGFLRPSARGPFLYIGEQKFYVRGVTYGTFGPGDDGHERHDRVTLEEDFAAMAAAGINAIRTYTVPERGLLDAAQRYGLRVMIGLPWEQHVTFLDAPSRADDIEVRVREAVRRCAGHPAILCYAIGNEIPAPIVRWSGAGRIERFLERLAHAVRDEDPGALVTYVNYPTTEYLDVPSIDIVSFNVYLEQPQPLEAYLARLLNLVGDRPLLLAEVGLDSRRNGEDPQAKALDWQIRATFASGAAGTFVFAWTDEWHRGGFSIDDWDFGITRRNREPKPALAAVSTAFAAVPFALQRSWPRISVVVCAYNAAATMRACMEGLRRVEYPNFDVIVVDDGSTDATAEIAAEYDVHLIRTPNRGLSNARNTGLDAATGEIVAYLDSDAFPDAQWLQYLGHAFMSADYAGIGGPNLAPPGLGPIADCFDHAPGGPVHVLISDTEAEHIPGCNMAFRVDQLRAIGGFDPALRVAGDDVDACWRLQDRGWKIGYSPGALVWHHRRTTLRSYLKQQRGYGRAEALLERKWPEKYNALGHVRWGGRVYSRSFVLAAPFWRTRIYHGMWGSAPYQSREHQATNALVAALPLMPEWYLACGAFAFLAGLGALWPPLGVVAVPLLGAAIAMPVVNALDVARRARFAVQPSSQLEELCLRAFVAFLHLAQPIARLRGRLEFGLSLWRPVGDAPLRLTRTQQVAIWSEHWRSSDEWLAELDGRLRATGSIVRVGGVFDDWDLQLRGGALGRARALLAVEEHGAGKQNVRFRIRPVRSRTGVATAAALAVLGGFAWRDRARCAAAVLGLTAATLLLRIEQETSAAVAAFERALEEGPDDSA